MIYVLPIDFDKITKVTEREDIILAEELANHKPLCYYVMNNNSINKDKAILERLDYGM